MTTEYLDKIIACAPLLPEPAPGVVTELATECKRLMVEVAHWKGNHDNQVEIKRILMDRPDLAERSKSMLALLERIDSLETTLKDSRNVRLLLENEKLKQHRDELIQGWEKFTQETCHHLTPLLLQEQVQRLEVINKKYT